MGQEINQYAHSPVHWAVARGDYAALKRILSGLPRLAKPGEVRTEIESIQAEVKADAIAAVIDRRDVPNRETPLHLAVKMGDETSVEMLMQAGADWSLQNAQGWSALQEAVCAREEGIAMIITRYYQPMAWAKWLRRLPRVVGTMRRMRDFYMELTFHFESSVIPFISRIAPSDTYRIWKKGANLRADMTLAGFDGFRIQRSDQSFLFLGDGSDDGKLPSGTLCVLSHKEKEIMNALDGAGVQPTESEIAQEVAVLSQTNIYRPGIDVTQAELQPHLTWRRQEKTEMVGSWKAKIYDMHHVTVSVRSRRVPGAMTDEELFASEEAEGEDDEDYTDLLTEEEKQQLDSALKAENGEFIEKGFDKGGASSGSDIHREDRKSWFSWGKKSVKHENAKKVEPARKSLSVEVERGGRNNSRKSFDRRPSNYRAEDTFELKKGYMDKPARKSVSRESIHKPGKAGAENEYQKGLRPVLWLTPDFPLSTEEFVPLLDILSNKVKAIRRLRELLTTKLPTGTFPVKLAIPVVPTIRVVVTFTRFDEIRAPSEEFSTPLSSPRHFQDAKAKEGDAPQAQASSASSWFSWMRPHSQASSSAVSDDHGPDLVDPFLIPSDYTWVDVNEKKRRAKDKKSKSKKNKKPPPAQGETTKG
ncbi:hypothetical protein SELMODRAFT_269922 [Selaginella moellendorffii]|uniref:Ankyrin repeat domain-containing protein n=2 Tax=Selaginella moellendorffii TaxID=88036 RepID=D8T9X2_SELML|nr:hypothetical protein SELMODRAFT_269922 [Selaginella moellendorffii]